MASPSGPAAEQGRDCHPPPPPARRPHDPGSAGCVKTGHTIEETACCRFPEPSLAPVPLGKSLAHPLYLSLQLLQVRFELGHPLLAVAEAPMEAVGTLPASATVATMAAVTRTGVPAPLVVTFVPSAAAGIIAARGMAAVTGAGAPAALMVTSVASAAAATIL